MSVKEQNLKDVDIFKKFLKTVETSEDVTRMFGTMVYKIMGLLDANYDVALSKASKREVNDVLDAMRLPDDTRNKFKQALQLFGLASEEYIKTLEKIKYDKTRPYVIPQKELKKLLHIHKGNFVQRKEKVMLNLIFYTGLPFKKLVKLNCDIRKNMNIFNGPNTITIDNVEYELPLDVYTALWYLIDPFSSMEEVFWGRNTKYMTEKTIEKFWQQRLKLYKFNRNYKISDILYTKKKMK